MKNILITSPTYPPFNSGLGNAVASQAVALASLGHSVTVATFGVKRETINEAKNILVEKFAVTGVDVWFRGIEGEVDKYVHFLQTQNFDLVLVNAWQNWATDLVIRNISKIPGKKFMYSHCASTNSFFANQPLRSILRYFAWQPYRWSLSRKLSEFDALLFLANGGSDSRFDDLRIAKKHQLPLKVVPNRFSEASRVFFDKPIIPQDERSIIMAVGSYDWQKGFDFVLKAYARSNLKERYPLHFYGPVFTAFTEKLRVMTEKLKLSNCGVKFHEGVTGDKLAKVYSTAATVLFGSYSECQPIALIDAMAIGTPFVARSTGCISGMNGGVAIKNPLEMAAALDEMLNSHSKWLALAKAGRRDAAEIYHPERFRDMLSDSLTGAL